MKAIIMDLLEDQNVGTLYLSTKFEHDRSTNNGDLLSDRKHWKRRHTHIHTHSHLHVKTQTHTHTDKDILPVIHRS